MTVKSRHIRHCFGETCVIPLSSYRVRLGAYVRFSKNTYMAGEMTVLSLKTELDVAKLLLAAGWLPEEINGILVFPLPRAAFHQISSQNDQPDGSDVIKATAVTPTRFYQAQLLLQSAGWLEPELESLLEPCLYSHDPGTNQSIHSSIHSIESPSDCSASAHPPNWEKSAVGRYRRTMALKRVVSLALVIMLVIVAVVLFG